MSKQPYRLQNGRRYLAEPKYYPLPADLAEMHRQTLKTIALIEVYGKPFCNNVFSLDRPPRRVLEFCCGTGIWSMKCHEYFAKAGHKDIEFVGTDIAPVALDLTQYGVNWQFLQWDARTGHMPFPDGDFDFVFVKEPASCLPSQYVKSSLDDNMRLLRAGGAVEVWETDSVFRTLLANPQPPPGTSRTDLAAAERSGTYLLGAGAAFARSQHRWLEKYNEWVQAAMGNLNLDATPCEFVMWNFQVASDYVCDIGSRRVAIPFCETRWEKEAQESGKKGKKPSLAEGTSSLTADQVALRQTLLEVCLDLVSAMEPILKSESGLGQAEWDKWVAGLTENLLNENGAANGECLEIGAWWAQRLHSPLGE